MVLGASNVRLNDAGTAEVPEAVSDPVMPGQFVGVSVTVASAPVRETVTGNAAPFAALVCDDAIDKLLATKLAVTLVGDCTPLVVHVVEPGDGGVQLLPKPTNVHLGVTAPTVQVLL